MIKLHIHIWIYKKINIKIEKKRPEVSKLEGKGVIIPGINEIQKIIRS